MPLNTNLKKVLIIGSGPIVIGQAAEFDYSGTQACKAIEEEGIRTVLVNNNPATIMTDMNVASKVYIEPIEVDAIEKIIQKEKPDGILAGFGGQRALNMAIDLKDQGILDKYGVKLLGTQEDAIKKAEDRELFKDLMEEIKEPIASSVIANTLEECLDFASKNGYPVIIRPAYTLGGTGGGIADNEEELRKIGKSGLEASPIHQVLIEQSLLGWKEIEYEVMRDSRDNAIIVCNMENLDPVGVHTGDSIVIAPSQTLRDREYQGLRNSAIKIIRSLKVEGGCNVQYALNPENGEYIVIEVNPRVSRSSALASKATAYPIAKIAAKIAIGYTLDELKNQVTKNSSAFFEPALDYIVTKVPKWPFEKFKSSSKKLGTQMKATGEVMSIGRSFESSLMKGISSMEVKAMGLNMEWMKDLSNEELVEKIKACDDERVFAIYESMKRGMKLEEIHEMTKIDMWFLHGIKNIMDVEISVKKAETLDFETLKLAKECSFTDEYIAKIRGIDEIDVYNERKNKNIVANYKMVDTCAGEFESNTPYYYSTYSEEDENIVSEKEKIVVLGSGPIRIGQGIEFDYSCVHSSWAIRELGYESIVLNNNPETMSTDFDTSDKLFFDPINIDEVDSIMQKENAKGVIVQFGGQTSINLAKKLCDRKIPIMGTSYEDMDRAEDREKFKQMLDKLQIPYPKAFTVKNLNEALEVTNNIGYPVLVRPSYVIGGRGMAVISNEEELMRYIENADEISSEHPILIDKYISGKEIEVDLISDGRDILIPGIMEHCEKAGVHSGDSISVYPPVDISEDVQTKLVKFSKAMAAELKVKGLMNIQYIYDGKEVYVIEVNPRASRTIPILSKVTNIPMVKIAMRAILGEKLSDMEYGTGLLDAKELYAVKIPVFSMEKIHDADTYLNPEMKSTGEVMGLDRNYKHAVYKGFKGLYKNIPLSGGIYVSLNDKDKAESIDTIRTYSQLGFEIFGSKNTAKFLVENNIDAKFIETDEIKENIACGKINIIINTPTKGNDKSRTGFKLRRYIVENRIINFTFLDTAKLFLDAIEVEKDSSDIEFRSLDEYFA